VPFLLRFATLGRLTRTDKRVNIRAAYMYCSPYHWRWYPIAFRDENVFNKKMLKYLNIYLWNPGAFLHKFFLCTKLHNFIWIYLLNICNSQFTLKLYPLKIKITSLWVKIFFVRLLYMSYNRKLSSHYRFYTSLSKVGKIMIFFLIKKLDFWNLN